MDFSLILIGAHDGSKTVENVAKACTLGLVLLVEPVPWLFEKLSARYGANPRIILHNGAIADTEGEVDFYAPSPSANDIAPYGDQLGSLNPAHARSHHLGFDNKVDKITVKADTIASLLQRYHVESVANLWTDTEGYDGLILGQFPFDRILPRHLMFEHKHIDGVNRVGVKFAHLLLMLDAHGYRIQIFDQENCLATLRA